MNEYEIYKSDLIVNNKEKFVEICEYAGEVIKNEIELASFSTTAAYQYYNIFSYHTSSDLFYDLYKELKQVIRDYVGDDRRIWFQSWLNILRYEELEKVLTMHGHAFDVHGFISIDPKKTVTEFVMYEIENEVGNIYIGPCGDDYYHRVRNVDVWDGNRITIGFDCKFDPDYRYPNKLFPLL
jgi:capsule polysaccharide modification protein KpsS